MKQVYSIALALSLAVSASAQPASITPVKVKPAPYVSALKSAPAHQKSAKAKHVFAKAERKSHPARIVNVENNPDNTYQVFLDQSFACMKDGSEASPVMIEVDDNGCIPPSIIGEDQYGYGGPVLGQAGGSLFVDNFDELGWMWTPDFLSASSVNISFKAMILEGSDFFTIYNADSYTGDPVSYAYAEIDSEDGWKTFNFTLDSYADLQFIGIYTDQTNYFIKDLKADGVKVPIDAPVATNYTDFTGTSFVANWEPVDKAVSYYLTVMEYDDLDSYSYITPYLIDNQVVEGTSFKVEGIEVGKIYDYVVQAFDGKNVSVTSNKVRVAALAVPENIAAAFNDEGNAIDVTWDKVPGANLYQIEFLKNIKAEGDMDVCLLDADFANTDSKAPMEYPEEPDEYIIHPEQAPTWSFVCPVMAEGTTGVVNNFLYSYFGMVGSIQSPVMDLSSAKGGNVKLSFEAASPAGNTFQAFVAFYYEPYNSYAYLSSFSSELSSNFKQFDIELEGATDNCFICLMPDGDEESYEDTYLFLRNLKASITLADGSELNLPFDYLMAEDNSATFPYEYNYRESLALNVTALEWNDDYDGVRLSSDHSENVEVAAPAGVERLNADNSAEATYFNLQGRRIDNPAAGQMVIKVSNRKASKVVVK